MNKSSSQVLSGAAILLLLLSQASWANLVAEWRMDESGWTGQTGEVLDSSGNALHGRALGQATVPTTVPGRVCNAGQFRGQGFNLPEPPWYINAQHQVEVGSNRLLSSLRRDQTNRQSLSAWFRADNLSVERYALLHKGSTGDQEYLIEIRNGRLQAVYWDRDQSERTVTINTTLQAGRWYFFGLSAEGSGANLALSLFLFDASLELLGRSSQNFSQFFLGPGNAYDDRPHRGELRLGAIRFGVSTHFFDGLLDEVRVHSSALTQADFAMLGAMRRDCPVITRLLAEYRMEQASWRGSPGEVLDTSGRGFHGTAEGRSNTAVTSPALPGNPGSCRYASLDGADSGIFIGNEIDYGFGNELTVMAWVRWSIDPGIAPAANQWANIFTANAVTGSGDNGQFWLQHNQFNSAFEIAVQTDQERRFLLATTQPQQGQWYHVAGVWDGNTSRLRIYVNGVEEGSRSLFGTSVAAATGNATHIGRWSRPGFRRFPGDIDEVRAFGQALDADEIRQWMNTRAPCEEQALNHIRIEHSGTGLTCQAESLTVRACADSACTQPYTEAVGLSFTSPSGNWTPATLSFSGQTSVGLQVTAPGIVGLNAVSNPAAPVRCFVGATETCAMEWADSGFLIEVPNHVSATTANGRIRAVRADDAAQACVPAFSSVTRQLDVWSQYLNPASGSLGLRLDGLAVATQEPGSQISFDFDADGSATFTVLYPDVGNISLRARYLGSAEQQGLVMSGRGDFVVRPAGLVLEVSDNPAADSATGPVFQAAGQPFPLVVAAVNAAAQVTPNFGRETPPEAVRLETELVAPAAGVNPGLSGSLNAFGAPCSAHVGQAGTACGDEFRFNEVGIIRLLPRLLSGAYLGTEDVPGIWSANIGRFIPDHFQLVAGSLRNRALLADCSSDFSSDFSYLGERFDGSFVLHARSALGSITQNYEAEFARLGAAQLGISGGPPDLNIEGSAISWIGGSGDAQASLSVDRAEPSGPWLDYIVRTQPVDSDGVRLGADSSNEVGRTSLLFGRLLIDSAIGSELGPLDLPWRVEVWANQTWRVNNSDACTTLDLATQISLRNGHGSTSSGLESIAVDGGVALTQIVADDSILMAQAGRGHLRLAAPLAPGWVEVLLGLESAWPFLRDDLNDDGDFIEDPSARASFGLFDGSPSRILLREVIPR